ncbi:MAG: carbon-nitrogen hydrolase family protein [Candidatus Brocadiaceae bacterium]|nr:carbon-nitrogen hydrolase family protein [Candidatus Brocadiaceae bacterium]
MTMRKPGPRPAVVGTCTLSIRNAGDADALLANGLQMIDEMAREAERQGWSPDILNLPEHFALPPGTSPQGGAEDLDGRTVSAVAERARAHGCYIVVPMYVRDGDVVHNSAVLLDRRGEPAGVYHKVFPVVLQDDSVEGGQMPGTEFPVFETDFGRVAIQICWDVVFEEGWEALAAREAELVMFTSAAPSSSLLVSHAYRYQYYIAGSIMRPPSFIVDPLGCVVAQSLENRQVAVARVDLDYRVLPSRYLWEREAQVKEKYGDAIRWNWHSAESGCLMTSTDPEMPIGRFVEIEKMMSTREWVAYNRTRIARERGGPPTLPPGVGA